MDALSRAIMIATEARQRARDNPFPIGSAWAAAFDHLIRYGRMPPRAYQPRPLRRRSQAPGGMMRCHWINDPDVGRVHIPGCWGAAINGPDGCYCPKREPSPPEAEGLEQRMTALEATVAELRAALSRLEKEG